MPSDHLPPLPEGRGIEDELVIEIWRVLSNVKDGTSVREGVEEIRKAAWIFAERMHGEPFLILGGPHA